MEFLRIINTEILESHIIRFTYSNGEKVDYDFKEVIQIGGVFTALSDPDVFSQVQIKENGRFIEFPGGIDFCADALRIDEVVEV